MGLLARQEVLSDLTPLGIAGEGREEVGTAEFGREGNGVLIQLFHVPWATGERGREDDMLLAGLSTDGSTVRLGIDDSLVGISADGLLILLDPVEITALAGHICIADEMLKQLAAAEEAIEFAVADLHKIPVQSQRRISKKKHDEPVVRLESHSFGATSARCSYSWYGRSAR